MEGATAFGLSRCERSAAGAREGCAVENPFVVQQHQGARDRREAISAENLSAIGIVLPLKASVFVHDLGESSSEHQDRQIRLAAAREYLGLSVAR